MKPYIPCIVSLPLIFGSAASGLADCKNLTFGGQNYFAPLAPIDEESATLEQATQVDDFSARYFYGQEAVKMHGVQRLQSLYFIYGNKSYVAIWDGSAVYRDHEQLKGHVLGNKAECHLPLPQGKNCVGEHATAVAGTIASAGHRSSRTDLANIGQLSLGTAPEAKILSFHGSSIEDAVRDICDARLKKPPSYVSNISLGAYTGWHSKCVWKKENNVWVIMRVWRDGGQYDNSAWDLDNLVYKNQSISIFKSAGNSRGLTINDKPDDQHCMAAEEYYECQNDQCTQLPGKAQALQKHPDHHSDYYNSTSLALAKNVITIGAIQRPEQIAEQPGPQEVQETPFTSFGPGVRGAVKPDLVAAGAGLWSLSIIENINAAGGPNIIGGREVSEDDPQLKPYFYGTASGTSFASPAAAGIGALLNELAVKKRGQPLYADEMKAILVHTASNKTNWPNYETGWGSIRADYAAYILGPKTAQRQAGADGNSDWISTYESEFPSGFLWPTDDTITPFHRSVEHIPGKDVRVTLVWLDKPKLKSLDASLVNDLDLVVKDPTGTPHYVWCPYKNFDINDPKKKPSRCENNTVDTVERVDVEAPQGDGSWRIEVTRKGGGRQRFALVVSGFRRTPSESEPGTQPGPGAWPGPGQEPPWPPHALALCHACYDIGLRNAPSAASPPQVTAFQCDSVRVIGYDRYHPSWAYIKFQFSQFPWGPGFVVAPPGGSFPWNRGWVPRAAIACPGDRYRCHCDQLLHEPG
jgi:hypothetical protein